MMYKSILRKWLFKLNPEWVHDLSFRFLRGVEKVPGMCSLSRKRYSYNHPDLQRELFGLTFKNPVGLAAGFDKNAKAIKALSTTGFGFLEIGTVTPEPQSGNPKQRLFRLPEDQAIINRMGFNNQGVQAAVDRLKKLKPERDFLIGGNIGKNKVTPNDDATSDYLKCFHALHPYVDYFVINVSSPNTPGLRELQDKEPLTALINQLIGENREKTAPKPILLKIAPDLTQSQLQDIVDICRSTEIDGIIATNTTIERDGLQSPQKLKDEKGGLSGKPLQKRSTEVIRFLRSHCDEGFPIIGVGGIMSAADAVEKLQAGADLIQLYTGFVYQGPGIVKKINKAILKNGL